jgi:hypothetical protein
LKNAIEKNKSLFEAMKSLISPGKPPQRPEPVHAVSRDLRLHQPEKPLFSINETDRKII